MSLNSIPRRGLPYDIWYLVFRELAAQDAMTYSLILDQENRDRGNRIGVSHDRQILSTSFCGWARELRYICRDFDSILKLYIYQVIDISKVGALDKLEDGGTVHENVKANILAFTRRLQIPTSLTPNVVQLIQGCRMLKSLMWCENDFDPVEAMLFNTRIVGMMAPKMRICQLFYHWSDGPGQRRLLCMIEDSPLPKWRWQTTLELSPKKLGNTETQRHSRKHCLRAFRFAKMWLGAPFNHLVDAGVRLPPMEELELNYYRWVHSKADYNAIWDFSCLRSLSLSFVSGEHDDAFLAFFESVSPSDLKLLQRLRLSGIILCHQQRERFNFIIRSLLEMTELEDLTLGIGDRVLPMDTILRVGAPWPSLRKLCLIGNKFEHTPNSLTSSDLRTLRSQSPFLEVLWIPLPMFSTPSPSFTEARDFLDVLATFEHLRDLKLAAYDNLGSLPDPSIDSSDQDWDDAEIIMRKLHAKVGVRLDHCAISLIFARRPMTWEPPAYPPERLLQERDQRAFYSQIHLNGVYDQWEDFGWGRIPRRSHVPSIGST